MRKINIFTFVFMFIVGFVSAQDADKFYKKNIFEALETVDTITKARVIIHQDKRIEKVLTERKSQSGSHATATASGYRVQVFSSNVQRTAKSDAFKVEKEIKEIFPEQNVYVNYTSPFWKVRVGDFKTMQEAQAFRNELINVFPNFKSETYTVKDQINL